MASTRAAKSVRLTERQTVETIAALEAVDLDAHDAAGRSAILTALERFRALLKQFQDGTR